MAATGDFAVPSFTALLSGGHEIISLITQPDRPAGRGRHLKLSRIKQLALDQRLDVLQPERLATPQMTDTVADLAPDLFLVIAYGQKIPPTITALPPRGAINVHASLLPQLRGAAPCNWAIIRGLKETGATVQFLAERIDAGDVLARRALPVGPRETAPQLYERLAALSAELLLDVLARIDAGAARADKQDESAATYAPLLKKEHGLIDWTRTAHEIDSLVRGVKPWPGAFTYFPRPRKPTVRLILEETLPLAPTAAAAAAAPGQIVHAGKDLLVATGHGLLSVLALKPESGKLMTAEAFCNGHQVKPGGLLGPDPS